MQREGMQGFDYFIGIINFMELAEIIPFRGGVQMNVFEITNHFSGDNPFFQV